VIIEFFEAAMSRATTISTAVGLLGLVIAMLAAIGPALVGLIALGFVMMALGVAGAVISAATSLTRAWQSAR